MKKKVLIGIIFVIVAFVVIVTAVVVGNIIASKVTCTHDDILKIEFLPSKAATCQEEGLTWGKKCNYCGKILVKQEKTNKAECKESAWIIDKEPTNTEDGSRHTECTMCGRIIQQEIISAGTQGLGYIENSDGTYTLHYIGNIYPTEIVIPSMYNGQKVTSIGSHVLANISATSITIPNTVKTIHTYAFSRCSRLENLVIPNGVYSIGNYCFYSCKALKSIELPDSLTSIGYSAFHSCTSLVTIDLPNRITKIDSYTFKGCTSLTTITIPSSVTKIMTDAFYGCTSLTTIKFAGTVAQWNAISFGTGWRGKVPATEVICANGTVTLG